MEYISYIKAKGLNRPSEQIALDLINFFNNTTLETEDFVYGHTQLVDVLPQVLDDENTFVPVDVDPNFDCRFTPHNALRQDGFLYRRLDVGVLVDGRTPIVQAIAPEFTTRDILGQINYQLQSQLSTRDVVVENLSATQIQIVVKISDDSLVWTGSFVVQVDQTPKTVVVRKTTDGQLRATQNGLTRSVV